MKKLIRVLISLLYIFWGLYSPISAFRAIVALDGGAIASALVGLLMLFAGIFGLLRIKPLKRLVLGIIIFVLAASSVITSLVGGQIAWQAILQALMAWLYIIW